MSERIYLSKYFPKQCYRHLISKNEICEREATFEQFTDTLYIKIDDEHWDSKLNLTDTAIMVWDWKKAHKKHLEEDAKGHCNGEARA